MKSGLVYSNTKVKVLGYMGREIFCAFFTGVKSKLQVGKNSALGNLITQHRKKEKPKSGVLSAH